MAQEYRCDRCGRKLSKPGMGRICSLRMKRELVAEAIAAGYDGKVMKNGVQLLIAIN